MLPFDVHPCYIQTVNICFWCEEYQMVKVTCSEQNLASDKTAVLGLLTPSESIPKALHQLCVAFDNYKVPIVQ